MWLSFAKSGTTGLYENHARWNGSVDGCEFNNNHELLVWMWSSVMAKTNRATKFVLAAIPSRFLPTKSLRAKANAAIVKAIAWDSVLAPKASYVLYFFVSQIPQLLISLFGLISLFAAPCSYNYWGYIAVSPEILLVIISRLGTRAIIWGRNILDGIFPSIDQFGNPMLGKRALKAGQSICGGWRGAFDSWTGDWKERALSHCFIWRNYQSTQVCDQCLAVKPFLQEPLKTCCAWSLLISVKQPLGDLLCSHMMNMFKTHRWINEHHG